jgi:hypothetical protein
MTLIEFREMFRKKSGRYDLVDSSFGDLGVDFDVRAAHRYLDREADIPARLARTFVDVVSGEWLVTGFQLRSIFEVWVLGTGDDGIKFRKRLTKLELNELRGIDARSLVANYPGVSGNYTSGTPEHFAIAQLRRVGAAPSNVTDTMDVITGTEDAEYLQLEGVIIMPPIDRAGVVEIVGSFYSDEMTTDGSESWWSQNHPEILYMAVMRQLEIYSRNREGVADWESAIKTAIVGIDMDGVSQDSSDINQMEG